MARNTNKDLTKNGNGSVRKTPVISNPDYNLRLREIIKERNLVSNRLSIEIGVTRQMMSLYTLGKRRLSITSAKKLGDVLGVNWKTLLD